LTCSALLSSVTSELLKNFSLAVCRTARLACRLLLALLARDKNMKNKPNLDLYPLNKKVSLDLPLCERNSSLSRGAERSGEKRKISAQELKVESLNLSTLLSLKSFMDTKQDEFIGVFFLLEMRF
jgi:hypothetical protein